ncbi:MAG TPA: hypothetical protein EYP14_02000, partial [Planctomycetaceae bacterium]|nr:hypothetical protein [Planctomycetaceae bacterium]
MARSKATVRHQKSRKEYTTIPIARLHPGTVIRAPIYDDRDDCPLLLLSAGTRITRALLEKIRRRGIETVRIRRDDLARMETDRGSRRALSRSASA